MMYYMQDLELGTAYLVGQIPQEVEDDPDEYEEGDDAPSEDFDDAEDEEGGIAFHEGKPNCMYMHKYESTLYQQASLDMCPKSAHRKSMILLNAVFHDMP